MDLNELSKIPKFWGAGIVSEDGFIIDSQFTVGYDPEKFGAMAARIISTVKKSLNTKRGSIILYTSKSIFFAKNVENGIFFALCQKDANIGLIKVKLERLGSGP